MARYVYRVQENEVWATEYVDDPLAAVLGIAGPREVRSAWMVMIETEPQDWPSFDVECPRLVLTRYQEHPTHHLLTPADAWAWPCDDAEDVLLALSGHSRTSLMESKLASVVGWRIAKALASRLPFNAVPGPQVVYPAAQP